MWIVNKLSQLQDLTQALGTETSRNYLRLATRGKLILLHTNHLVLSKILLNIPNNDAMMQSVSKLDGVLNSTIKSLASSPVEISRKQMGDICESYVSLFASLKELMNQEKIDRIKIQSAQFYLIKLLFINKPAMQLPFTHDQLESIRNACPPPDLKSVLNKIEKTGRLQSIDYSLINSYSSDPHKITSNNTEKAKLDEIIDLINYIEKIDITSIFTDADINTHIFKIDRYIELVEKKYL